MSPLRQPSTARSGTARASSGPARRARTPAVDAAAAEAIDLAREAAEETAHPQRVGEHLGLRAEGDRVVTHFFESLDPAYRGWQWSVTVARAARAKQVTVDEVVLLPGDDALLAPEWVPWLERLRPGDLGPGDLLPTPADDPRLVPGFSEVDESVDQESRWELGLGRPRVLSREGREEAAARWYDGIAGPRAPIAISAPAQCSTCGFFVSLAGDLRQVFGVCANEYAPDDGRVVSADHGCGAHSEAVVIPPASEHGPPVIDEIGYDIVPAGPLHDPDSPRPAGPATTPGTTRDEEPTPEDEPTHEDDTPWDADPAPETDRNTEPGAFPGEDEPTHENDSSWDTHTVPDDDDPADADAGVSSDEGEGVHVREQDAAWDVDAAPDAEAGRGGEADVSLGADGAESGRDAGFAYGANAARDAGPAWGVEAAEGDLEGGASHDAEAGREAGSAHGTGPASGGGEAGEVEAPRDIEDEEALGHS